MKLQEIKQRLIEETTSKTDLSEKQKSDLVLQYQTKLITRVLSRTVFSREDREDYTQEILLKIYTHEYTSRFNGAGAYVSWIKSITKNYLIDRVRQTETHIDYIGDIDETVAAAYENSNPEYIFIDRETCGHMLSKLSKRDREVVELLVDNASKEEVLTALGISNSNFYSRLQSARDSLDVNYAREQANIEKSCKAIPSPKKKPTVEELQARKERIKKAREKYIERCTVKITEEEERILFERLERKRNTVGIRV